MLQNKFEMPLDLVVKSSKIFSLYFYLIFIFSIISIFISSLSLSVQLLLLVLLFVVAVLTFKKQNLNKVTSLKLSGTDEWEIEINNKERYAVELYGECIVTYFLIWLNFTTSNSFGRKKVFHVLLLPDSADKDLLRQLRVRLRFLSSPKVEAEV
ncbi:MAG: hypothetical protein KAT06_07445 [Gammaproteobacteria bacterium]|nr:hypothetical protein [Gammaproteobacteria bacterium]